MSQSVENLEIMRIIILSIFVFIALALVFPNVLKYFRKATAKPQATRPRKKATEATDKKENSN